MIDFLKYRGICALLSLVIFGSFVGLFFYKKSTRGYAFNYSVDFTGGTQVRFKFSKPVSDSQLREILEKNGWTGAVIRNFPDNEKVIRLKEEVLKKEENLQEFGEKMKKAFEQSLTGTQVKIGSIDSVSAGIGAVLRGQSLMALIIALLLMLTYIWVRFWSVSFGVGAIVALAHDAVVILLIFMLLDKEISIEVISAILTILGYSINDTIVIFTKIRQNLKIMKNVPLKEIVNISINQTLRRTLLTSFATLLVVISMMVLGGESLRDFSLALLIGMIFGTYSSIYIASPVMLWLHKKN